MQSRTKSFVSRIVAGATLLAGAILPIQAATIVYNYDTIYTGYQLDQAAKPWLRATFSDQTDGSVWLKLEVLNLQQGAFVGDWWFNLDDPTGDKLAGFYYQEMDRDGDFAAPTVNIPGAPNSGAGLRFTWSLEFAQDNSHGLRFDDESPYPGTYDIDSGSDSITLKLMNDGGVDLNAIDFLMQSIKKNGLVADSAVFVLGVGENNQYSVHIKDTPAIITDDPKPLPDNSTTVLLLGLSILCVELLRRYLNRRKYCFALVQKS